MFGYDLSDYLLLDLIVFGLVVLWVSLLVLLVVFCLSDFVDWVGYVCGKVYCDIVCNL